MSFGAFSTLTLKVIIDRYLAIAILLFSDCFCSLFLSYFLTLCFCLFMNFYSIFFGFLSFYSLYICYKFFICGFHMLSIHQSVYSSLL